MTKPDDGTAAVPSKTLSYLDVCAWIVIGCGLMCQTIRFFQNEGLLYNECRVALNVLDRDFAGLTKPLDYLQAEPIGFLWVVKFLVQTLGNRESSLRLFSLAAGMATPIIFWLFARRSGTPRLAAIGTLLLASNFRLLSYSAELRGCSVEVTTSAVLLAVGAWMIDSRNTVFRIIAVSLVAAVALWFSFSAVFVVLAVWFAICGNALFPLWKPEPELRPKRSLAVIAVSVGTAIIAWSLYTNWDVALSPLMSHGWPNPQPYDFAPYPPNYLTDVIWYVRAFAEMLVNSRDRWLKALLMALPFFIGLLYVFCKRPWLALMLILPSTLAVVTSIVHCFGFAEERLLFLQPFVIFLVAQGIEQIVRLVEVRRPRLIPIVLYTATACCVIATGFVIQQKSLEHYNRIETRPALAHVCSELTQGDVIYVTQSMSYPFRYYAPFYRSANGTGLAEWPAISIPLGRGYGHEGTWANGYRAELDALLSQQPQARRVWVLTSTIDWTDNSDLGEILKEVLKKDGEVDQFRSVGVTVLLLTLRDHP